LFAGSFGLISGQSIGDAARKERERRSAAENVQATTSVPNSTVSNSTQRNTAGFRDCGKELKCLVEAVEAGKPAFVSATFTFHDRDFGENSLTYYMDVAEFKHDTAAYYFRLDGTHFKFSEENIREELKKGRTRGEIADTERLTNDAVRVYNGGYASCIYNVPRLAAVLKQYLKSNPPEGIVLQLVNEADSCQGPLALDISDTTNPTPVVPQQATPTARRFTDDTHPADGMDIPQGYMLDLDNAGKLGREGDIWFEARTDTVRFMVPLGGVLIGMGNRQLSNPCSTATLTVQPIPIEQLQAGSILCVSTRTKKLVQVLIRVPAGSSPGTLRVSLKY
jgi:hypothetical protein